MVFGCFGAAGFGGDACFDGLAIAIRLGGDGEGDGWGSAAISILGVLLRLRLGIAKGFGAPLGVAEKISDSG